MGQSPHFLVHKQLLGHLSKKKKSILANGSIVPTLGDGPNSHSSILCTPRNVGNFFSDETRLSSAQLFLVVQKSNVISDLLSQLGRGKARVDEVSGT
jgi:hypothetical protein